VSNPGPKLADVAGVKTATEMGSGTSTNVRILYYDAFIFRQPAPIYPTGSEATLF
jgi:hypothetical protein